MHGQTFREPENEQCIKTDAQQKAQTHQLNRLRDK